ncbi:MAG: NAD-dependent epimerase/dehydratase family protein, partial [Sulfurimonas sp.]|nr:NAD-dependent epimerase/dehydratase family protein [Sulfurimonas sp.]
MKVLLTGSNGFIGNYFKDNYENKYNINTFSFLNDNFQDLDLQNTDTIIHLSALVHQMGGASEKEYEKVNVTQTLNLANKAKENGVKHFIFMSTVKVYGEETKTAYKEDSSCNPQDDYGKSKLKAEIELQKLENDNFKISIIRTPIVYGYGVKANIKSLINLVDKVSVLPFADIENKRSMVYVGNLCYLI